MLSLRRRRNQNRDNNEARDAHNAQINPYFEGAAPIGPHVQLNNTGSLRNMVLNPENSPASIASDALSNV